ncbi:SMP-30/gluconolactonase/LRE family protein [Flavitalea flava]
MKKIIIRALLIIPTFFLVLLTYALVNSWTYTANAFTPPVKPGYAGILSKNEVLQHACQLSLQGYYGPEDIAEKNGFLYCGARADKKDFHAKGKILKIDLSSGEVKEFASLPSWLGAIQFDNMGNLIACVIGKGLASIDSLGQVTWLALHDSDNQPFQIPNDMDIAGNGDIFFSVTSGETYFNTDNMVKLLASSQPQGGLYCYHPSTGNVETIAKGFLGINGVSLTQNEQALLVVEMGAYRIKKIWIKGEKKGTQETIAENLPGFPNNIVRRKDGTFWLAFSTNRNDELDKIHPYPLLKKIVMGLPGFLKPQPAPFGLLLHIDEQGKILNSYYDTQGKTVSEMSSVFEYKDKLYMGGDNLDHLNYIDLNLLVQ